MPEPADLNELPPDKGRQAIDAYQAWRLEFFLPGQQDDGSPSAAVVPAQRRGTGTEGEDSTHSVPRHLHSQVCPDPLTDGSPAATDDFPVPGGGECRD